MSFTKKIIITTKRNIMHKMIDVWKRKKVYMR